MIFSKKYLFLILTNFVSVACAEEVVTRVINGDLFIVPNGFHRSAYSEQMEEYEMVIPHPSEDIWIQVWATSKGYRDILFCHLTEEQRNDPNGSCNWKDHGHPHLNKFPAFLPLTLFLNAKGELMDDGDTINLVHNNPKTHEKVIIMLRLNQRGYRYGEYGSFRKILEDKNYYRWINQSQWPNFLPKQ